MRRGSRLLKFALQRQPGSVPVPTFLVKLEPWHRVFLSNLFDFFRRSPQPPLRLISQSAVFWPDVFVVRPLPWKRFAESLVYHALAIAFLWGVAQLPPRRARLVDPPAFSKPDVIYYEASEYLPPLDTTGPSIHAAQEGDPVSAPQPIISVPPDADNRTQTIVTPPKLKLNQDVPLPNIVAWSQPAPEVPLAATASAHRDLQTPMLAAPVAPPPELQPSVSRHDPTFAQAAVVEPPPQLETAAIRRPGDISIGHTQVVAPAPQLPVAEQRAVATRQATLGDAGAAVVPPPPSLQGTGASNPNGRLIALGIHPLAPTAPVEAPAGNRRGTFAATPEGKPGAKGTPGTNGTNAQGSGNGSGSGSADRGLGIPPGIFVGAGPNTSTVEGNSRGTTSDGSRLIADATPPRVTSTPRHSASEPAENNPTEIERKVFGGRKSYSMTLNVPNLNSATGSWVIHFAEMGGGEKGELVAPLATQEVDPGYPLELMRHNVQGTVTLYAVIRSDGSVGQVRVLNSVDDRLDDYACAALSQWKFRPAMKNGNPVALEAVVMIPFRPLRGKGGF
jgi:TonB family protein